MVKNSIARQPTESEKQVFINSSNIFASQFSFLSPKYDKGKGGNEFCDCILEYQNTYIVFQIKERTSSKLSYDNWFEKNVKNKALEQLEKTASLIRDANNHHFYLDDNGKNTLYIDKSKTIVPVLIFLNNPLSDYPRVLRSVNLDCYINVFEMKDFIDAFNTLLVPNEIVNYLGFRINLLKNENDLFNAKLLTFENKNHSLLIGGGIKGEADFAEIYYQYYYFESGVTKEHVIKYNSIISYLDKAIPNDQPFKKKIINFFLSVNIPIAIKVTSEWYDSIERCSSSDICPPYSMHLDDLEVLLVSKPFSLSGEGFEIYYKNLTLCYSYKDHISNVITIAFSKGLDGEINIIFYGSHYAFNYPDKELEERFKDFFDNYK